MKRKTNRNKYPLRKIINRVYKENHWMNELECGHLVMPPSDIYGETYPIRQRCRFCYKELSLHKEQKT